ncbi:MAG: hypothetical protein KKH93_00235 [Candidatus Omnitrophica bacterium]|nr:hypothetical protein [Candidatus Omnitrophota bacterium]MBU2044414.1 hypothetical protein [Candidatus Omnitrophota bacterium]MBU2473746.1 hypothetical protein [Candidatus Omnitrophota bacterium]
MNLKDEIRKLAELQELDSQIYELNREHDVTKPESLQKIKTDFQEKQSTLAKFETDLKNLQLKKKEREIELATKEDSLRKAQGQLYQLKTNKEYQAKLTEIGSLKADISVAEEEVLKTLEEIDVAKTKLDQEKAVVLEIENKYKLQEGKVNQEIKDIEVKLSSLNSKRDQLSREIDKTIAVKYEKLILSRNGLALAAVKNNNCSACHLALTHQKINEIKMYDNMVFCENCVRMLYLPEDIFQ